MTLIAVELLLHYLDPTKYRYCFTVTTPYETAIYRVLPREDPLRFDLLPGAKLFWCSINDHGFRGHPVRENLRKIAFIGDSVVFGVGLNDEETLPYRLQEYFASSEEIFQVLNFGVPGYNTEQASLFLERQLEKLTPDMIILGYTLNDDLDSCLVEIDGEARRYYAVNYKPSPVVTRLSPVLDIWLARNSRLYLKR
ncbi:MAG: SGNH/GDSL hydrolase family protein [Candidatus Wallbacteria bacterium]|nr:SGNH/GDSL hydrolase family protein [Candidatus Wallbacteria bacterium]